MAHITPVQKTTFVEPVKETAKTTKNFLGRQIKKAAHAIKAFAAKVWAAIVDFFKNFPARINTGFGLGAVGIVTAAGLLIGAHTGLKRNVVARNILTAAAVVFLAAATALMILFGRNPVFARAAV